MKRGAKHRPNPKTRSQTYRVYPMPETLRKAVRRTRAAKSITTRDLIEQAIDKYLPPLVQECGRLLPLAPGPTRPARLPLADGTLAALQKAAKTTRLDQSRLLLACLAKGTK